MFDKYILRFIFVGLLNTIFGYSVYALLLWFGLSYFSALMISTILGIIFNFQTIGRIVFQNHNLALITKFFAVYLVTFIFNWILIKLGIILGFNAYISGFFAIIPAAIISFLLNKYYVFQKNASYQKGNP